MIKAIKWILIALACAGFIAVMVIFSSKSNDELKTIDQNKIQTASSLNGEIGDFTKGNLDSKLILVEYGDYQCPGCSSLDPIVQKIVEEYKDKIGYTFRNYLLEYHTNTRAITSAVIAAGLQGKFWEVHDAMFDRQSSWEMLGIEERTAFIIDVAKESKLDIDKFKSDIGSDRIAKKIRYDRSMATKSGLKATPSLYLNGKAIDLKEISDIESFRKYLDKAIAENIK